MYEGIGKAWNKMSLLLQELTEMQPQKKKIICFGIRKGTEMEAEQESIPKKEKKRQKKIAMAALRVNIC